MKAGGDSPLKERVVVGQRETDEKLDKLAPGEDGAKKPLNDEEIRFLLVFFRALERFGKRKRVMFLLGLALGSLLMIWEDPVSYCAAKRMLWSQEALLRVDPMCATAEGSLLPRKLAYGISSLSQTIATTMPEGLKFNLSEVQLRVAAMEKLVDFMPSLAFPDALQGGRPFTKSDHAPGATLAEKGIEAKHPVVMIPGVITTGLELWRGERCASKYFRQRVWGTFSSLEMFLLNPKCWLKHMMLDEKSGLDPENIKIRAALGFEAADYVIGGYWVWAKLIENLAEIGYTPQNMEMIGYDWRLSFRNLERRDRTFTRLKNAIESQVETNGGEKAVVVTHSMGGNVFFYFMQWVESPSGGNHPGWLDAHVEAFTAIGVPFVGIPSALTRLASGVIREFTELGTVISGLMELHMETKDRRQLMRSWGSIYSLLPKGGSRIWNQYDHFPPPSERKEEEEEEEEEEEGEGVEEGAGFGDNMSIGENEKDGASTSHKGANQREEENVEGASMPTPPNLDEILANDSDVRYFAKFGDSEGLDTGELMAQFLDLANSDPYIKMYASENSFGAGVVSNVTQAHWTNPLEAPLLTQQMRIYCLYGYGLPTERGYYYEKASSSSSSSSSSSPKSSSSPSANAKDRGEEGPPSSSTAQEKQQPQQDVCVTTDKDSCEAAQAEGLAEKSTSPNMANTNCALLQDGSFAINTNINKQGQQYSVRNGIRYVDGDGSVPLLSMGLMCAKGWRRSENNGRRSNGDEVESSAPSPLNPKETPVVCREYLHKPSMTITDPLARSGPGSSDHVDIMGNHELMTDIMLIAAGRHDEVRERIGSNINDIASYLDLSGKRG